MFVYELSPEEEEAVIERSAQAVVKYSLETPAILLLKSLHPMAHFGTQMLRLVLAPLFIFLGRLGDELLLVYEKGVNVQRLVARIEELRDEKERRKEEEEKRLRELANIKEEEENEDGTKKKGRFLRFFRRS
jgi:hypothetical protein